MSFGCASLERKQGWAQKMQRSVPFMCLCSVKHGTEWPLLPNSGRCGITTSHTRQRTEGWMEVRCRWLLLSHVMVSALLERPTEYRAPDTPMISAARGGLLDRSWASENPKAWFSFSGQSQLSIMTCSLLDKCINAPLGVFDGAFILVLWCKSLGPEFIWRRGPHLTI
jgi:hypothetical protein